MEFYPEAVEFFEYSPLLGTDTEADGFRRLKCRIIVGYVIGNQILHTQPMGGIGPVIEREDITKDSMIGISQKTYNRIPHQGEIRIDIFGYHLGMPVEYDDDGEPIGNWPKLGEMTLQYQEKILMPGGRLPEGYRHLQVMRLGW